MRGTWADWFYSTKNQVPCGSGVLDNLDMGTIITADMDWMPSATCDSYPFTPRMLPQPGSRAIIPKPF